MTGRVSASRIVDATPDDVFTVITDVSELPDWNSAAYRSVTDDGNPSYALWTPVGPSRRSAWTGCIAGGKPVDAWCALLGGGRLHRHLSGPRCRRVRRVGRRAERPSSRPRPVRR